MIKKQKKQSNKFKRIRHIIAGLYRIKNINRKEHYYDFDLRKAVFSSAIGIEISHKLQKEKITLNWLRENGFKKVAIVYEFVLQDK